jgi:hypothetical protein
MAAVLSQDPYNRTRHRHIKKLEGMTPGKANTGSGLAGGVSDMTSSTRLFLSLIAVSAVKTPTEAKRPYMNNALTLPSSWIDWIA